MEVGTDQHVDVSDLNMWQRSRRARQGEIPWRHSHYAHCDCATFLDVQYDVSPWKPDTTV